jgi:Lar family restriction alleviation protein
MKEELKACPFCGFEQVETTGARPLMQWYYYIYCNCCECRGPISPTKDRAAEAWNKRGGEHE